MLHFIRRVVCNKTEIKRFLPKWGKRKNGLLQSMVSATGQMNSSRVRGSVSPWTREADRAGLRSQPRQVQGAPVGCSSLLSLGFLIFEMGIRGFWGARTVLSSGWAYINPSYHFLFQVNQSVMCGHDLYHCWDP